MDFTKLQLPALSLSLCAHHDSRSLILISRAVMTDFVHIGLAFCDRAGWRQSHLAGQPTKPVSAGIDQAGVSLSSVHPNLVIAVLSDVAHPWKCLVAAFFNDFKVANLDTGHGEVGDLKLNLDGHTAVLLPLFRFDRGEAELGAHEELFAPSELLDAPDH